ncbi:MAG TPA: amidase family protein [Ramlibacter sp.]|uniref:amidase family protein n=1 Tax=Ramlibacter sp. TaxID=1917967 RepID=UPI002D7EA788|nr:amidase family protein [Ramlibacter sp.]HET8745354.1 amidase family protein [Ramlibacter sp.]
MKPSESFVLEEASVASIHAAMHRGELTAVQLVQAYLARIEACDRRGPALRALLTLNPRVLEQAAQLDAHWRAQQGRVGPLHGIPVILKDNFDTQDLPTTGGSVAMRHSQPRGDAFTVQRLREAGALVLAKANLQEFARGGISISSLGGQTLNPYDLTRTPGGSSGGTGAAIAANFAVLGTGSDTGQSIRSPASACCLVGVRPTRGLVSRGRVMPNSFTQDEVGPIVRTVEDAARLLSVMAGYDPRDPVTALGAVRPPTDYLAALRADGLRGARIGLLEDACGQEERHAEVNAVMEQVLRGMESLGATVLRLRIPGLEELTARVSTDRWEARAAFEQYFAGLGADQPVTGFRQLVESNTAVPPVQQAMEAELAIEDGLTQPEYLQRIANRDRLRVMLASRLADLGLDAILYPLQRILVVPAGEAEQAERNGVLSHGTGFPAVTFPGGFSRPTATAPLGVPIGAELLGPDFSEAKLLSYAYAFEQATRVRQPPRL